MRGALLLACAAGASALSWTSLTKPFTSSQRVAPGAASPAVLRTPVAAATAASRSGIASVRAVAELSKAAAYETDLNDRMMSYVREHGGDTLIRRVLIANNGMAAVKTIMSIRKWAYRTFGDERAVEFVVMASAEDLAANAEFIRRADSYVEVPGGSNANNYANVQLIVDLCIAQSVDAVFVGWGHASENPKLGEMLIQKTKQLGRKITFVGPTSPVMRVLGDKIGSILLAQAAGVSTMPWNGDGMKATLDAEGAIPQAQFDAACIFNIEQAIETANRIGYPVMLKASEGGGGKGIRKANDEEALRIAYPQVVTEVPGSPIFIVSYCSGARHIEVQVVGDQHGNAIALGGRDCSTQRRFQKIFEEAPPLIVPDVIFDQMMHQAVDLCQSIGYQSAGTVEWMYQPRDDKFFFLELNPRLQVEHPVTEGITDVSLPATQLHIAMGIPLFNVPEVRRFYGKDYDGIGSFDLTKFKASSDYPKHVMAARITAENPDEGFKPTSGKIDRINFQSDTKVWGYFSVVADGGVHEYADSQFGHLFATGETREDARKALVLALKELFIMGDIRTTVEYLGTLLETEAFRDNTIDTAWLDGIIATQKLAVEVDLSAAVINAAVYKGYTLIKDTINEYKASLGKGQLSTLALKELQSVPLDLTYKDVKYSFSASPKAPDVFVLSTPKQSIEVRYREQADGSLYVAYGAETHQLYAKEEPLGLRMVLDGTTVMLPNVFDPSEIRSDVTGKLVRYLVDDGAEIKAGQPFAEAEAMKMLLTIRATDAGVIRHTLSAGSIINQGDMLATLELKDPSKVKKIGIFDGVLSYEMPMTKDETALKAFRASQKSLELLMDGYLTDFEPQVQKMLAALSSINMATGEMREAMSGLGNKLPAELDMQLQSIIAKTLAEHVPTEDTKETAQLVDACEAAIAGFLSRQPEVKKKELVMVVEPLRKVLGSYAPGLREYAIRVVCALLQRFLSVEAMFGGQSNDQAIAAMLKAKPDDTAAVYTRAFAHEQLPMRRSLAIALLRSFYTFPERFGVAPLKALTPEMDVIVQLAALQPVEYKEVALVAAQFELFKTEQPFEDTVAELKTELLSAGVDSTAVSRSVVTNALLALFPDKDVGTSAMQVALKRFYRAFDILEMSTAASAAATVTTYKYKAADKTQGGVECPVRYGQLAMVADLAAATTALPKLLASFEPMDVSSPLNVLLIALQKPIGDGAGAEEAFLKTMSAALKAQAPVLVAKGVRLVTLIVPNPPKWPRLFSFTNRKDFGEDIARRNMYPTMYNMLELDRLSNWSPVRLPAISHNSVVLLGSQGTKPRVQQRLFARGVTHSVGLSNPEVAEGALLKALDELQLAYLDKRVMSTASSYLFLHVLPAIESTPEAIINGFKETMEFLITKHATRLLKLSVDEIEVRVHCKTPSGERQAVRLMATSMSGQWLKTDGYIEYLDPVTGVTTSYCSLDEQGDEAMCFVEPYPIASALASKRSVARRIGTTYAYDFLGLFEKAVVKEWQLAIQAKTAKAMPANLLEADEFILDAAGSLVRGSTRPVGENKVGMVGFHVTLKTPEYPEGRPLVIVANDCTVQSGSFGVEEDEFFDKVSKYARGLGLPRLHIASNSGARIGLAEELKPYFQVAWNEPSDVAKGFKYLFFSEEDANRFRPGTDFHGEWVTEGGEKRYKLIDIVGEKDGLGVENLRGSGLIAGETSAAYAETFTLSYVTGRSVGIGAYINRLAQRVIQMQNGPLLLTGFGALNKLLGKEVYTSQDQLGGPQIMLPNGVAHQLAIDDQDGVAKVLRWLSYVPRTASEQAARMASTDPLERRISFLPTKTPYDPRHMLAGTKAADGSWVGGFFDRGSFTEYLADWGKSVVVGRAKLGGVPMGVIAVETRVVEQRIPADPANPASRETVLAQAGQVWYPDSAFKTAQAISDFNAAENLPLIVFANWRGFSGGTRDMFSEILKFGSYIVDNLRTYKHPVFAYIPPNGELRGGAWVVIDPTINEDMMEMYADTNARGGILEPPGICEVKFRRPDLLKSMNRLDFKLKALQEELSIVESSPGSEAEAGSIRAAIEARENTLMPLYTQISYEFADLHDRPGRMMAKGVIRDVVDWPKAREYFGFRVRRRLAQDALVKQMKQADAKLAHTAAVAMLSGMMGGDWEDDKAVIAWFESAAGDIAAKVVAVRDEAIKAQVADLVGSMSAAAKAALLKSL